MITHVYADAVKLVRATGGILAHQTNNIPVANAGIAQQIALAYPSWLKEYMKSGGGTNMLGRCWTFDPVEAPGVIIASLFAQATIVRGRRNTNYEYLANALEQLSVYASRQELPIYVPFRMSCGLAGGAWEIVLPMIEYYLKDRSVIVVELRS